MLYKAWIIQSMQSRIHAWQPQHGSIGRKWTSMAFSQPLLRLLQPSSSEWGRLVHVLHVLQHQQLLLHASPMLQLTAMGSDTQPSCVTE